MKRQTTGLVSILLSASWACSAGSSGTPPSLAALDCPAPVTFDSGKTPKSIRHVATTGDDAGGDGSAARPFRSIQRAARDATPGVAVQIHAGTYQGEVTLPALRGTADDPIWIMGAPGEARPNLTAGNQGIYMPQPRYVVMEHLEISYTNDNGINVDDGERLVDTDAAQFVVFRDLDVHDTGRQPAGIGDCLKLSGVNDFVVLNSRFTRCGKGPDSGSVGVGGVGVHRGTIYQNSFTDTGYGGVQVKGGAADVDVVGNRFEAPGYRGVNLGGSTSRQAFRPPLKVAGLNYEATRIRVTGNVFLGGESAAAFVGCIDCLFGRNTVVYPSKWALRVLQESVVIDAYSFAPVSKGTISGNVFFFRRATLSFGEDINVGPNTDTATFSMADNMWFAQDAPERSRPILPTFAGDRSKDVVGQPPVFVNDSAGDYRVRDVGGVFPPGAPSSCAIES